MFKRLVVATSVSALAVMGTVAGASAGNAKSDSAPSDNVVVKVVKVKAPKPPKQAIDWDAPAPISGGVSTQRIDWD